MILNFKAKLVGKAPLTDKTFLFTYADIPAGFTFKPGQFVGLKVEPFHLRAYSIFQVRKNEIDLIIDLQTKSGYFIQTQIGDMINMSGPYGVFSTKPTNNNKVFICTGSGMVPFYSMIKDLKQTSEKFKDINVELIFGARYLEHDFAFEYFKAFLDNKNFKYSRCITRAEESPEISSETSFLLTGEYFAKAEKRREEFSKNYYKGRVTQYALEYINNFETTEFYICGSTEMVNSTAEIIKAKGGNLIYMEKFG